MKILEALSGAATNTVDLITTIISSRYGASLRELEYNFRKLQNKRAKENAAKEINNQTKQRYLNLLYKLKKDGLIKETEEKRGKLLMLTDKGRKKIDQLKIRAEYSTRKNYPKEINNFFTIVSFDIPEKEKRKRAWLRESLKNIGLEMIQKSVWIGKVKLPKEFIDDMRRLKIIPYVEIFQITKSGTLKNVAQ